MDPPLGTPLAAMRFLCNHLDVYMLLVLAVLSTVLACVILLRSPRTRRRLQLGPRRPSAHARSLPATPARRALDIKHHDSSPESASELSSPQDVPVVSVIAEAIATQWSAKDLNTQRAYRASFEDDEAHDREYTLSSACHDPPSPSTASFFSTVYGVDYGSNAALLMVDGALVAVPNESGSTVRVTELNSPITPVHVEFYSPDDAAELDNDSLDPELWRALFDGIEPESPTEWT